MCLFSLYKYHILCYTHIMKIALKNYRVKKSLSKKRGIPFLLTFDEWYQWWLSHGVDRNIKREFNKDTLCMCRKGDIGPYSLDNIYCATMAQNTTDRNKNCSPFGHNPKPIQTPLGKFNSIREAERVHGCGSGAITYRLRTNQPGYQYL